MVTWKKISHWAFQWQMSLNPDIRQIQNHLRLFLDSKLDFKEHKKNVLSKVSKTIGLLRKLQKMLTRPPFITIHKSFIKRHLDYGDIIYDQACNVSFHEKLKSFSTTPHYQ